MFFACEGAVALIQRLPVRRESSVWAIEGTKAHAIVDFALRNGIRDAAQAHAGSELADQELDDGTNEFHFAIQVMLNHVFNILDENPDAIYWLETFVDPPVQNAPGEAGGYCDVAIYLPSTETLRVVDYKHGAGIAVEADTKQVKQYACGFLFDPREFVNARIIKRVVLEVVQPRAFHKNGTIRSEVCYPYDLYEYLLELDAKIARCEAPGAALTPGVDQCRFCDARTVCPAREQAALAVAHDAFKDITSVADNPLPDVTNIDIDRLAAINLHAPMLHQFLKDVTEHLQELAEGGIPVPGHKLVTSSERRVYHYDRIETARRVGALLGVAGAEKVVDQLDQMLKDYPFLDMLLHVKLKPLTQVEKHVTEAFKKRAGRRNKRVAAAQANQSFAFITTKKPSATRSLVPETDPRPAVGGRASVFKQLAIAPPPPLED